MSRGKIVGRANVFVCDKKDRPGAPALEGKIFMNGTEYQIDLWKEECRGTTGYMYKGQIKERWVAPTPAVADEAKEETY